MAECAARVVEAHLDDLELFVYDANQPVGTNGAISLDMLSEDSFQVGEKLGARREGWSAGRPAR